MPYFGAHMPTAGGLHLVFEHIRTVKGECLQLFTRNQRQWHTEEISDEEAEKFAAAWKEWPFPHVFSHASYLINLASPKDPLWKKSITALAAELERCRRLGIKNVVLHPGAHTGSGPEAGIGRVAKGLDKAFAEAGDKGGKVDVLLENTAGAGTMLGARLEELAAIITASDHARRLGVCWDTCHGFAAGFDPRPKGAWGRILDEVDEVVGLSRLRFMHVNDSKNALESRKDRHEHIGKGEIGREGFGHVVNEPRLRDMPMCLETPKGKDLKEDVQNLAVLRGLVQGGKSGSKGKKKGKKD